MKRTVQFNDEKHHCIFLQKGEPFILSQDGLTNPLILCAFHFRTAADVDRAEEVLRVCRKLVEICPQTPPPPPVDGIAKGEGDV